VESQRHTELKMDGSFHCTRVKIRHPPNQHLKNQSKPRPELQFLSFTPVAGNSKARVRNSQIDNKSKVIRTAEIIELTPQ